MVAGGLLAACWRWLAACWRPAGVGWRPSGSGWRPAGGLLAACWRPAGGLLGVAGGLLAAWWPPIGVGGGLAGGLLAVLRLAAVWWSVYQPSWGLIVVASCWLAHGQRFRQYLFRSPCTCEYFGLWDLYIHWRPVCHARLDMGLCIKVGLLLLFCKICVRSASRHGGVVVPTLGLSPYGKHVISGKLDDGPFMGSVHQGERKYWRSWLFQIGGAMFKWRVVEAMYWRLAGGVWLAASCYIYIIHAPAVLAASLEMYIHKSRATVHRLWCHSSNYFISRYSLCIYISFCQTMSWDPYQRWGIVVSQRMLAGPPFHYLYVMYIQSCVYVRFNSCYIHILLNKASCIVHQR